MGTKPLSVAVCAVEKDGKLLLLRRKRGDYQGLWSLPGGKIEHDEHMSEAAVREVREELGIETEFRRYLGLVSEHLTRDTEEDAHFMLSICLLDHVDGDPAESEEGEPRWVAFEKLDDIKFEMIPSDYKIIEELVLPEEMGYFECIVHDSEAETALESFNRVSPDAPDTDGDD